MVIITSPVCAGCSSPVPTSVPVHKSGPGLGVIGVGYTVPPPPKPTYSNSLISEGTPSAICSGVVA